MQTNHPDGGNKKDMKTMTQAELNKKAMADIFALEDSKDLFEAIGGLNDEQAFSTDPADTEYGVDDMLTVIPGSTDPFAGQSIMSQEQQEPSDEDKKFVIDRFSELMAKDHKDVVSPNEIDSYTPIIQKEVGMRMNVNQFLTDIMNSATQRLSSQNVSEAQPTGAATDEIAPQGTAPEAPVDPAAMGTPAMEPAPGGVVAEPSLDANVGAEPAPGDDLGLGELDGGDTGLDDFGAEPAPDDDLGLGDVSDDAGLDTPVEGEDDLGLGDVDAEPSAEGGDDLGLGEEGGAEGAEGAEGGEEGDATLGDDDELFGGSNLDSMSDDEFGGDDEGNSDSEDVPSENDDAEFEAEMAKNKAILESIHTKYVEDSARERVRTLVESYVRTKKAEKQAQLEAAETERVQFEAKADEMRNELGDKVATLVEAESNKKTAAILENAAKAFDGAMKRKTETAKAKKDASRKLAAKLEAISTNFHKVSAKEAAVKKLSAKLESISAKYAKKSSEASKADAAKAETNPMTESVKDSVTDTLAKKLKDIVDSVK